MRFLGEICQMKRYDYLVVGGGVIGLTIASVLRKRYPQKSILLIEKEANVAEHASGRNSGVLHAGFYYSSDTLKAKLTASGNKKMKEFCFAHDLAVNECGKVVVAQNAGELPAIAELKSRGERNGVVLKLIDEKELTEIDPNVKTFSKALFSPTTASVNPTMFCYCLRDELLNDGVEIRFNTEFLKIDGGENIASTSKGDIACEYLINCAGLYADEVAHKFGLGKHYTMLPFKGIYLKYLGDNNILRTNVYPVPNLQNPFLGVHFTKTVTGDIKIGPTAMPAFWREQYGLIENFKLNEFVGIGLLNLKLLLLNPFGFRSLAASEMRKYFKSNLIKDASGLVHSIGRKFKTIEPGIRAQLLDTDKNELIMDFLIAHSKHSTHLLNAVSPAFTCSFSIAEHVLDEVEKNRA